MNPTGPAPRAGRARRIALIRRRVAATALATFVLAFGVITATGAMGAQTASTAAAPAAADGSSTAASDDGWTSADDGTRATGLAPLTTRQS